jgi:hypothetical protein
VYEPINSLNTVQQNTNHKTQFVTNTNSYLLTLYILEFEHSNILKITVRAIDTIMMLCVGRLPEGGTPVKKHVAVGMYKEL